jgi:translation initiation factor 2 subunit 2
MKEEHNNSNQAEMQEEANTNHKHIATDFVSLELDLSKKKKKKKQRENEYLDDEESSGAPQNSTSHFTLDSTKPYPYEYLLDRALSQLKQDCPCLIGKRSKTTLQPLDVQREGTKKTVVTNFSNLCKVLNRDSNHVFSYFMAELCTNGSIDGNDRLIIKGKFSPTAISTIARKYIHEYVMCSGCKGLDTLIDKDKSSRLLFLRCNLCQASQSIKPILQGYRAKI